MAKDKIKPSDKDITNDVTDAPESAEDTLQEIPANEIPAPAVVVNVPEQKQKDNYIATCPVSVTIINKDGMMETKNLKNKETIYIENTPKNVDMLIPFLNKSHLKKL